MVGAGVYAGVKRLPPVGLIWFWLGAAGVVALVVVDVVVVVVVVVLDGLLLPPPPQAVSAPMATIATAPKTAAERLVIMFVFTGLPHFVETSFRSHRRSLLVPPTSGSSFGIHLLVCQVQFRG